MFGHVLHDVLDGNVDGILDNPLVQVADNVLDHAELLEQFASGLEDFVREDVLFAVYPEVWESFLGRV